MKFKWTTRDQLQEALYLYQMYDTEEAYRLIRSIIRKEVDGITHGVKAIKGRKAR